MSITEQRLKDYQLQMSIYAEQHKMILASDVLNMVEQLQDDLKDDVGKVIEQLESLKENYRKVRENTYCRSTETDDCDSCRADHYLDARLSTIDRVIEIMKGGGVDGN